MIRRRNDVNSSRQGSVDVKDKVLAPKSIRGRKERVEEESRHQGLWVKTNTRRPASRLRPPPAKRRKPGFIGPSAPDLERPEQKSPRRVAAEALAKHRRSSALQFGPHSFPPSSSSLQTSTNPYRQCFNRFHQYIDHHKVLRANSMQSFFASGTSSISRCTVR